MLILFIGAGGLIGAILRHLVDIWANSMSGSDGFPYGTLVDPKNHAKRAARKTIAPKTHLEAREARKNS